MRRMKTWAALLRDREMDFYSKQHFKVWNVRATKMFTPEQFTMCTNKNTLDKEDSGHTHLNRGIKRDQDDGKATTFVYSSL